MDLQMCVYDNIVVHVNDLSDIRRHLLTSLMSDKKKKIANVRLSFLVLSYKTMLHFLNKNCGQLSKNSINFFAKANFSFQLAVGEC